YKGPIKENAYPRYEEAHMDSLVLTKGPELNALVNSGEIPPKMAAEHISKRDFIGRYLDFMIVQLGLQDEIGDHPQLRSKLLKAYKGPIKENAYPRYEEAHMQNIATNYSGQLTSLVQSVVIPPDLKSKNIPKSEFIVLFYRQLITLMPSVFKNELEDHKELENILFRMVKGDLSDRYKEIESTNGEGLSEAKQSLIRLTNSYTFDDHQKLLQQESFDANEVIDSVSFQIFLSEQKKNLNDNDYQKLLNTLNNIVNKNLKIRWEQEKQKAHEAMFLKAENNVAPLLDGIDFEKKILLHSDHFDSEKVFEKKSIQQFLSQQKKILTPEQYELLEKRVTGAIENNVQFRFEREQAQTRDRELNRMKPGLLQSMDIRLEDISNDDFHGPQGKKMFAETFMKRSQGTYINEHGTESPFAKQLKKYSEDLIPDLYDRWEKLHELQEEKEALQKMQKCKDKAKTVLFTKEEVDRKMEYWKKPELFTAFLLQKKIQNEYQDLKSLEDEHPDLWKVVDVELKQSLKKEPLARWKEQYVQIEKQRLNEHFIRSQTLFTLKNIPDDTAELKDPTVFALLMNKRKESLNLKPPLERDQLMVFEQYFQKKSSELHSQWLKNFDTKQKEDKQSAFSEKKGFSGEKINKISYSSSESLKTDVGQVLLKRLGRESLAYMTLHELYGQFFDPFLSSWSSNLSQSERNNYLSDVSGPGKTSLDVLKAIFSSPYRLRSYYKVISQDQTAWKLFQWGLKMQGVTFKELLSPAVLEELQSEEDQELKEFSEELLENTPEEQIEELFAEDQEQGEDEDQKNDPDLSFKNNQPDQTSSGSQKISHNASLKDEQKSKIAEKNNNNEEEQLIQTRKDQVLQQKTEQHKEEQKILQNNTVQHVVRQDSVELDPLILDKEIFLQNLEPRAIDSIRKENHLSQQTNLHTGNSFASPLPGQDLVRDNEERTISLFSNPLFSTSSDFEESLMTEISSEIISSDSLYDEFFSFLSQHSQVNEQFQKEFPLDDPTVQALGILMQIADPKILQSLLLDPSYSDKEFDELLSEINIHLLADLTGHLIDEEKWKKLLHLRAQQKQQWWKRLGIRLSSAQDFEHFFDDFKGHLSLQQVLKLFVQYCHVTHEHKLSAKAPISTEILQLIIDKPKDLFWSLIIQLQTFSQNHLLDGYMLKAHQPAATNEREKVCVQLKILGENAQSLEHHEAWLIPTEQKSDIRDVIMQGFRDYFIEKKSSNSERALQNMKNYLKSNAVRSCWCGIRKCVHTLVLKKPQ
ncbi:MAG: hypothetical protein P1V18_01010, partial [Candidatus Gracilibacteria bacterium]|nr:hypothetical protein [Candidatus Gracilibacteria bacterium]